MIFLEENQLRRLVLMRDVLNYVEEAYKLYGLYQAGKVGASFSPMISYPTKVPHTDADYRSGSVDGIPAMVTTLGWGFWDNPAKYNLPSVSVVTVLSDVQTGRPLCLMTGYYLAAARTGAAGGVASKYLARRDSTRLGIVGAGSIGHYMLASHRELFDLEEVRVWSRTRANGRRFVGRAKKELGQVVKAVDEAREAVEGMDIVCAAVPSREPVVKSAWISEGTHINAFGADAKGKQELEPAVLKRAKIVVDDLEQCKVGGEINVPLSEGLLESDGVYAQIGEIVNGWKPGRVNPQEITIMDSTGLNILDVVACYRAFKKAKLTGAGIRLKQSV